MSWGNPKSLSEKLVAKVLSPLSWIYGLGVAARHATYQYGILSTGLAPCPVISIGNITCGGTGKTPTVLDIAKRLQSLNLKVGILSRGYGRENPSQLIVVSDGAGKLSSVKSAGDEPMLLAQSLPKAVVIVCSDRVKAANIANRVHGCQVLILDDGFQYRRLKRDVNIALIDYADEPEKDSLMPSGRLREPLSSLQRASHIIITKVPFDYRDNNQGENQSARLDRLKRIIRKYAPQAQIFCSRTVPRALVKRLEEPPDFPLQDFPLQELYGKNLLLFCGLAKPDGFKAMVNDLGAHIVKCEFFPDHHWYQDHDIDKLNQCLADSQIDFCLTTLKDIVRIDTKQLHKLVYALDIETQWINSFPKEIFDLVQLQRPVSPKFSG